MQRVRPTCIYCGGFAASRDHVPPRGLLNRPLPANLRTVPSCARCNHGASGDEQYFLVLLGQVATSPALDAKLAPGGQIDRTLQHAPALEERLLRALSVDNESGRVMIAPDLTRIHRVVRKLSTGLFFLRYGWAPIQQAVGPVGVYPYNIRDDRPPSYFIATFTERFKTKQWRVVQRGVFSYIFVRDPMHSGKVWCVMDLYQSVWAVVHFPNPKSKRSRITRDLWLFPELASGDRPRV